MALTLEQVSRPRGGKHFILELSLSLPPGVTAVMGPNGSGKTTLLKTAAGLLSPDRGAVHFNGAALYPNEGAVRVGYIPQEKVLPQPLKVKDALYYLGALYGAGRARVKALLEEWGLQEVAGRPLQLLSPGETRRFFIAQSFLQEQDLWVFDEVTTGLDAVYRPLLLQKINRLRDRSATVVMATQFTDDVSAAADRLVILEGGRVKYCGSPAAANP